MLYSCGIIFYQNGQILLGHCTGQKHWDLPKGKAENNESFVEAAIRECKEETGFIVKENELILLGEVSYRKGKRLVLFFCPSKIKPNPDELRCSTTYVNKHGKRRPDIDSYKYVDLKDCPKYLTQRMSKSILKCTEIYKKKRESK